MTGDDALCILFFVAVLFFVVRHIVNHARGGIW